MSEEAFYGVTLKGKDSVIEWDVLTNEEEFARGQKLIVKQILLGAEAKEGEFNVVEVHTIKDSLKIPIAVLKAGETRAVYPDIEFYDTSITFKLIQGNGPVYIHGQNLKDCVEVVDMESDEEVESDEEAEEEETEKPAKKKIKLDNNSDGGKNVKQNKRK